MKKLILLALLPYLAFASDFEQGFLESQNGEYFIKTSTQRLKILTNQTIQKSLPSL